MTPTKKDFGTALDHLRQGLTARRAGWPQAMFIAHEIQPDGQEVIWLYPSDDRVLSRVRWVVYADDVLAYDWEIGKVLFKHPVITDEIEADFL